MALSLGQEVMRPLNAPIVIDAAWDALLVEIATQRGAERQFLTQGRQGCVLPVPASPVTPNELMAAAS